MPRANDRIGPYQLIRKLGEGGFGEVWLAQDFSGSSSREVAVKMPLDTEIDLDALLQEATLWARATGHPNVLEFLSARVFEGQVVLVSEYAPDGSLKDWLRRHGGRAPSVEAAVEMARGILAGLEHLHGRNIIHRDVKPDNVLLLGATPRLADFGISRVLKSTSKSAVTAGTPPYMAPEAFNRKRNQQTDLWSVGVMLYQMLSGRLPFDGNDIAELYGAILKEEPEPLPAAIPDWVRQIVAGALIKDPEQRYQTVAEMSAALATPPPRIEENSVPPLHRTITVDEPPPRRERILIEPQPKLQSASLRSLRMVVKWGAGLVVIIALATYLATKMPSTSLLNLGEAFAENLNGVTLEMIRVPSGEFLMGSPENEPERYEDEGPQHRVIVPSFYIGKYEVTQAQWKAVMGNSNNPSHFKGDDLPVDSVPFELPGADNDVKEFCEKLSRMTGKKYRLPSEAEWEYACRAGTTTPFAFGSSLSSDQANFNGNYPYGGAKKGVYRERTVRVGSFSPNAFKLYDMHGNVWEWCEDVYHDSYGGQHGNPPVDGTAWTMGGEQQFRVLRGGSWFDEGWNCRSTPRVRCAPSDRRTPFGLRVVVSAKTQ